jgi:antitoxin ParD1/3/4
MNTSLWYYPLMSKNTSVILGDHFMNFVSAKMAEGRYSSASDVVRAGLRLLEDEDTKLAMLRAALIEGEASGPAEPFDFDIFKKNMRTELKQS